MFTGIIETVGKISSIGSGSITASFKTDAWNDPIAIGESIAVSGCCLTAVTCGSDFFSSDLSEETLQRSSLGSLKVGNAVNLERAMKLDGRFGGHIVQGHVDGTGIYLGSTEIENSRVARIELPAELSRYLVDKCSICIEGISLTVVRPEVHQFEVWVIPHTWANTSLCEREPGDKVNVEIDLIARYVEKLASK